MLLGEVSIGTNDEVT